MTVLATAACLWAAGLVLEPTGVTLEAYIGPGAGIALLGSFFAVFAAALSAFFFVLSWPVRMIWRGLRGARPGTTTKHRPPGPPIWGRNPTPGPRTDLNLTPVAPLPGGQLFCQQEQQAFLDDRAR